MRIVRFLGGDGRVHHGEQRENGAASLLLDPQGVLGPAATASQRELFRGRSALVADDDRNMRELMATTLTKAGCSCTVCADGREAIEAIGQTSLDFIVSDILMPHHNGYEVFAAARSLRPAAAVVLVTGFGYDPSHSLVRASQEGLETVLYKPFTPQDLLDELARAALLAARDPVDALLRSTREFEIQALLAPLEPVEVLCIGRNYAADGGPGRPDDLEVFLKPTSSVIASGDPIRLPAFNDVDPRLDVEGELAIVIGAVTRDVSEDDALRHVLGFTIANDVTARHWQTATGPPRWMRGKGFDTFCPLGPAIVTRADLEPAAGLRIRTRVNGRVVREGSTASMQWSVAALVSRLSRHLTLRPGTVVLTGAPPVAPGIEPGTTVVRPGDEVEVEIDGIGTLTNPVETAG